MYLKVEEWINWETPKLAEIGRQCKTKSGTKLKFCGGTRIMAPTPLHSWRI